jgi:hypothetical protein
MLPFADPLGYATINKAWAYGVPATTNMTSLNLCDSFFIVVMQGIWFFVATVYGVLLAYHLVTLEYGAIMKVNLSEINRNLRIFGKNIVTVMLLGLAIPLISCGSGDDDERPLLDETGKFNYSGAWEVNYNLIKDECRLVFDILVGVTDQLLVLQSNGKAQVSALNGLIVTRDAFVNGDDDLVAERLATGDVFANGDNCNFRAATSLSANPNNSNRGESLLSVTVTCASGFQCETQGTGTADRQVRPDDSIIIPEQSTFDF